MKKVGIAVKHDLPGVGENMQDHLDLFVIAECTGDHTYDGVAKLHRTLAAGPAICAATLRPGGIELV
ncbi:hypothetical protein VXQ18_03890 [Brucella abortus]|nr:hypothetical protein [Brucella abortus]